MNSNLAKRTQFIILAFILAVLGSPLVSTSCQQTSLEEPLEAKIESMYLYPPSQQASPGQEIAVTVEVNTKETVISGCEIRLTFNPDVLKVTEVETGDLLGVDAIFGLSDIDNETGEIRFALARNGEGPDSASSSVLSVIKLKVLDTAISGSYQLNPCEVLLTDDEFNFIPDITCQGSYIEIMDKQTLTYALAVVAIPGDGGYVRHSVGGDEGEFRFESNEVVQLMAVPDEGYEFDYWSGDVSGSNPSVRLVMDSDKTVIAHFKPVRG